MSLRHPTLRARWAAAAAVSGPLAATLELLAAYAIAPFCIGYLLVLLGYKRLKLFYTEQRGCKLRLRIAELERQIRERGEAG